MDEERRDVSLRQKSKIRVTDPDLPELHSLKRPSMPVQVVHHRHRHALSVLDGRSGPPTSSLGPRWCRDG